MKLFSRVFIVLAILFTSNLSAQIFNYTKIENPVGFNFSQTVGEFQDKLYLTYFDDYFNQGFYAYSDGALEEVQLPVEYTFGGLLTIMNDQMFVQLNDDYFNGILATINANGQVDVYPEVGFDLFQYLFEDNGSIYISFFDITSFDVVVKIFNGSSFVDFSFPSGFLLDEYLGKIGNKHYMFLEDGSNNSQLYSFENGLFEMITTPAGLQFPFTQINSDERLIFTAFDLNFNNITYELKNDVIQEIVLPVGYDNFTATPQVWNGEIYFGVADTNFDNDILAKRGTDDSWTLIDNPPGLELREIFENGLLDDEMNLSYNDPNNFLNSLAVYDGSAFSELIAPPQNFNLSDFLSQYKGGKLLSYFDTNYYNNILWYLKGGGLSQAPTPSDHPDFSFYAGQFGSNIYMAFEQGYNDRTLYQLSLNSKPESADSSVTTTAETPYKFKEDDFPFFDSDQEDVFGGIQISTLPTKGILHLNGAQINVSDIIAAEDLSLMFYVPLDDGTGSPYDEFKFKAYDGFEASDLDYTMFINVLSTSLVQNDFLSELKLYPNPTSDLLNIEFQEFDRLRDLKLSVIDPSGKIIKSRNVNVNNFSLSLGDLLSGSYLLIIHNNDKSVLRKINVVK